MASYGKMFERLKSKLLALAEAEVDAYDGPSTVSALARQGRVFNQPIRLRRGWRHECHRNSAEVWGQDTTRYKLCTGYALSEGRWIHHSWVLDGDCIIETTYRMGGYFGVVLPESAACRSWLGNYLQMRYPGPLALFYPVIRAASNGAA